jgi:hypothetical protein
MTYQESRSMELYVHFVFLHYHLMIYRDYHTNLGSRNDPTQVCEVRVIKQEIDQHHLCYG